VSDTTDGPLANLRVLEMGQLVAGPFCAQLLGDFGAEVIKLEPPGTGDPMRQWVRAEPDDPPLWFSVLARNKKSATVDLRTTDGQQLAMQLVREADIVVENFRPGTLERWHLGYDELRAANPRVILVRVTGFGQSGPYASRAGYGSIGEAMGGLRYITGDPSAPPSRVGVSIGDMLAGMFAAIGALVAVHARQTTGTGQVVDAALYEAVLAMMESLIPEYALHGFVRERTGPSLSNVAPSNVYPTADGDFVLVAANQDTVFARLAAAMGQPELAVDARFGTHQGRAHHQVELDELIGRWTVTRTSDELETHLNEFAVPTGRIYRASDMLADAHFRAREAIVRVAHAQHGAFPMQNVVPRLSATPGRVRTVGPSLGEHNDEVWGDFAGVSSDERVRLRAAGVI
jgi:formyl-CoA transferase